MDVIIEIKTQLSDCEMLPFLSCASILLGVANYHISELLKREHVRLVRHPWQLFTLEQRVVWIGVAVECSWPDLCDNIWLIWVGSPPEFPGILAFASSECH